MAGMAVLLLERLCMLIVWCKCMDVDLRAKDYRWADAEDEYHYRDAHKLVHNYARWLYASSHLDKALDIERAGLNMCKSK
jgi:two-component SAPR family response regulator